MAIFNSYVKLPEGKTNRPVDLGYLVFGPNRRLNLGSLPALIAEKWETFEPRLETPQVEARTATTGCIISCSIATH
jgi:hypothetical protein